MLSLQVGQQVFGFLSFHHVFRFGGSEQSIEQSPVFDLAFLPHYFLAYHCLNWFLVTDFH